MTPAGPDDWSSFALEIEADDERLLAPEPQSTRADVLDEDLTVDVFVYGQHRADQRQLATVLAIVLLTLAVAILVTAIWRWILALPVAAAAALLIIRRHPVVVVWIAGAMPGSLRSPVQRFLAALADGNAR